MKLAIDLDAALQDFSAAMEADGDAALGDLLQLLLDPATCQARIALLEVCSELGRADHDFAPLRDRPRRIDSERWTGITNAVATLGPVPAMESGRVTLEELDALTRDAEALRQVHERLSKPLPDRERSQNDTVVPKNDATLMNLTWLARNNLDKLRERLQDVMPALVAFLGWPEEDMDDLADVLTDRARRLGEERFRHAVGAWLAEYATQRQLTTPPALSDDDWRLILYRSTLRTVANSYRESRNPPWVAAYFDAVGQPDRIAPRSLLDVRLTAVEQSEPSGLPGFRLTVYNHVRAQFEESCREFELS